MSAQNESVTNIEDMNKIAAFYNKMMTLEQSNQKLPLKKECKELVAFPYVDISDVPQNRFGKLRKTGMPVIMVCGTSSKQGKFHVQLELRKRFLQDGYIIFQVSRGQAPRHL